GRAGQPPAGSGPATKQRQAGSRAPQGPAWRWVGAPYAGGAGGGPAGNRVVAGPGQPAPAVRPHESFTTRPCAEHAAIARHETFIGEMIAARVRIGTTSRVRLAFRKLLTPGPVTGIFNRELQDRNAPETFSRCARENTLCAAWGQGARGPEAAGTGHGWRGGWGVLAAGRLVARYGRPSCPVRQRF